MMNKKKIFLFISLLGPCILLSGFCFMPPVDSEGSKLIIILRCIGAASGLMILGVVYYLAISNIWMLINLFFFGLTLAASVSRSLFNNSKSLLLSLVALQLVLFVFLMVFNYKKNVKNKSQPNIVKENSNSYSVSKLYSLLGKSGFVAGFLSVVCVWVGSFIFLELYNNIVQPVPVDIFSVSFIIFVLAGVLNALLRVRMFQLAKASIPMDSKGITLAALVLLSSPIYFFFSDVLEFLFLTSNKIILQVVVIVLVAGIGVFLRKYDCVNEVDVEVNTKQMK